MIVGITVVEWGSLPLGILSAEDTLAPVVIAQDAQLRYTRNASSTTRERVAQIVGFE